MEFVDNISTQNKNVIILGGGIPGIFSALYLSKLNPSRNNNENLTKL